MAKSNFLPAGVMVLIAAAVAQAADDAPFAHLSYQLSMRASFQDAKGKLVAGTEVMHLLPYQGRLYAGTSFWLESDPSAPKACQVLVLDSPQGPWRLDHQFTRSNPRLSCLKTITFTTDAQGHAISAVSLLLAAPDVARGPLKVFCRDDATGDWTASVLGSVTNYTSPRSLGVHRDRITGIDRIFAGATGDPTPPTNLVTGMASLVARTEQLDVISGVYDPAAPGRIRWESSPEFHTPEGESVMAFCNCSGALYCATSRHIYQRADGLPPAWKGIYSCPKETSPSGIRGLSAVPNPAGAGEVLLFVALSKVRRLDPADGFKETVELDMPEFLTRQLGVKVTYALAAYKEFLPCTIPSGETVWLFGFECCYPAAVVNADPRIQARVQIMEKPNRAYFPGEARYCVRHARGADVRYDLAEILDSRRPLLVSTRVITVSPFPEDQGRALYFGGFDCNSVPSHNTAWIYRGQLPAR